MLQDKPVGHRGNRRWHLRKEAVAGRPHQSVALGKAKLRGRKSKRQWGLGGGEAAETAEGRNGF